MNDTSFYLDQSGQENSNYDRQLDDGIDFKILFDKCEALSQFCKIVFHFNDQKDVVQLLLAKIDDYNDENQKIIYRYFTDLLFINNNFDILSDLGNIFSNPLFNQMVSEEITKFFTNVSINDSKKGEFFSDFLYRCRKLNNKLAYQYEISPLYNVKFTNDKNNKFFKFIDTIEDPDIFKQTKYFWRLWDNINQKQRVFILNNNSCSYLCPYTRNPFHDSPVALLFAGGNPTAKSHLYPDEQNCCLLAHHLNEIGYKKGNIMCFVEGKVFKKELYPPFKSNQIRFSNNMVLCSYQYYTDIGFKVFEGSLNSSSIFSFSIIKAVMDAKGPVLIFFSNHGGEYAIHFPITNDQESEFGQSCFKELCDILDTFRKHVLFILDCCGSEEFVSFSQRSHYQFIHFITSSINMNDVPSLDKSLSLSTMNIIVTKEDQKQNIILSSQFTRFFLDSIHSITPAMSLNQFVDLINSKGNVGFKAKLQSNNPIIPISIFLQAPLFKYINYIDLVDTIKPEEVTYFGNEAQVSYLCVEEEDKLAKHDFTDKDDNFFESDESDFATDEYFLELSDEGKEEKDYEQLMRQKIHLKDKETKQIIDATIVKFASSYESLRELKYQEMDNPDKADLFVDEIYLWFIGKYRLKSEGITYATRLLPLNLCYPDRILEIKSFLDSKAKEIHNGQAPILNT